MRSGRRRSGARPARGRARRVPITARRRSSLVAESASSSPGATCSGRLRDGDGLRDEVVADLSSRDADQPRGRIALAGVEAIAVAERAFDRRRGDVLGVRAVADPVCDVRVDAADQRLWVGERIAPGHAITLMSWGLMERTGGRRRPMTVALVHDYLTQRGGAERVVLSLTRAFPDAPVYTSLYDPGGTFPEFAGVDVRTLPINRLAPLRAHHRAALPLLAPSFSRLRVSADVVICSSSGWAHGATGRGPEDRLLPHTGALALPVRPLSPWPGSRGPRRCRTAPVARSSGGTRRRRRPPTPISPTRPSSPSGSGRSTASTPRSCPRRRRSRLTVRRKRSAVSNPATCSASPGSCPTRTSTR